MYSTTFVIGWLEQSRQDKNLLYCTVTTSPTNQPRKDPFHMQRYWNRRYNISIWMTKSNVFFQYLKHSWAQKEIPVSGFQQRHSIFTKPFRNGKTPMLTRDFLVPSREGIFCLLRREKYSSFCRGNFLLSVDCSISLFPLFPFLNLQEN